MNYYNQVEFGELVLVIGDLHIPNREVSIPQEFQELLVPNKVQRVICTGNIGNKEQLEQLRSLSNNFIQVKGDQDNDQSIDDFKIFKIGRFRIGLIHGHQVVPFNDEQSLSNLAMDNELDIIIYGHSHEQKFTFYQGKYFINPGSATGAYSTINNNKVVPSFILLEFKDTSITLYFYTLVDRQLVIDKTEINSNSDTAN